MYLQGSNAITAAASSRGVNSFPIAAAVAVADKTATPTPIVVSGKRMLTVLDLGFMYKKVAFAVRMDTYARSVYREI